MIATLALCACLSTFSADAAPAPAAKVTEVKAANNDAAKKDAKSSVNSETKKEVKEESKQEEKKPSVGKSSTAVERTANKPILDPKADADLAEKKATASQRMKEAEKKDADDDLLPIEANVVSYTNAERARYGLPPLQVDKNLMRTARDHCSWMTRTRTFMHTRMSVAENIAMGQPDSENVVRTWMNSSGHRANILNPFNLHIGVAAYRTEDGTIYWCQQFSN